MGIDDFGSKTELLYVYREDEEKKEAQDRTGEKRAGMKTTDVQPVLRIYLRLQGKEDVRKEEETKKDSKEDDSVLPDIGTYSDSDSLGESGEASPGFLKSIGGLLSR